MKPLQTRMLAIASFGLLGICAGASQAGAQNAVNGSFTLSHEIRWQGATLPAGDYTFTTSSSSGREPMLVKGPKGAIFQLPGALSYDRSDKPSVLILERHGIDYCVRELDLNGIGLQIRYRVPNLSKHDRELAQGPEVTERVLIALAK